MVGARQPGKLPPARCSPLRSQVWSQCGAGAAESLVEQQGRGGGRRSCLGSSQGGESTRNASLQNSPFPFKDKRS